MNVTDSENSGESSSDSEFEGFKEEDIRLIRNVQQYKAILNPYYDQDVSKAVAANTTPTIAPFTRNVSLIVNLEEDATPNAHSKWSSILVLLF